MPRQLRAYATLGSLIWFHRSRSQSEGPCGESEAGHSLARSRFLPAATRSVIFINRGRGIARARPNTLTLLLKLLHFRQPSHLDPICPVFSILCFVSGRRRAGSWLGDEPPDGPESGIMCWCAIGLTELAGGCGVKWANGAAQSNWFRTQWRHRH